MHVNLAFILKFSLLDFKKQFWQQMYKDLFSCRKKMTLNSLQNQFIAWFRFLEQKNTAFAVSLLWPVENFKFVRISDFEPDGWIKLVWFYLIFRTIFVRIYNIISRRICIIKAIFNNFNLFFWVIWARNIMNKAVKNIIVVKW